MADEKRRLIYELVVEAVGADKFKNASVGIEGAMKSLVGRAKQLAGPLAAAFTLKNIQDAIDDMTRYNAQLEALGVTGADAATALAGVQTAALATGQSMQSVGAAMLEAINLQQVLGRNTEYASRTTEAFVAIAVSEGKTADAAAQQIQKLSFALDSGTLSGKEFIGMLKSSNTFQTAAKEALGKTTEELVAMAKAGDITSEQLVRVIGKLEEIGAQKSAIETTQTLTEKFKTLFSIMAQGIGRGARGTETKPKEIIDPDAIQNAEKLRDAADGIGLEIGGLARTAKNAGDIIADGFQLSFNMLTGGIDDLETARELTQAYTRDVRELAAAWQDVQTGFYQGTTSDPRYSDEAKAKRKKERETSLEQARVRAENRDISRTMEQFRKEQAEKDKKAADERAAQRERDAKKAAEDKKKAEEQWKKDRMDFKQAASDELEKSLEDQGRKTEKLGEAFGVKDLEETLAEVSNIHIPGLRDSWLDSFQQMDDITATLEQSLGGLFDGGISNAREFFATLTQGIASIFAQLAAKQAAEGFTSFLGGLFGGFGKWTSASAATQAGSGLLDNIYNAAKGRAFHRGWEIPMATGGVVSGPTVMPMASGTGLMGEAGPEAVMPLKRTSGGRLGVSAAMPSITIVNRLGVPATARMERSNDRMTVVMEAAQLGASLAQSRISRSLRTGYGDTAQSIQRTYGLRRK